MTPDDQIDHIVRMMLSGDWAGSKSHKELAAGWGCHPRTVGDRAVVASGILKRAGGPLEDWVLGKLSELEHIKTEAMAREPPLVKTAVDAIRLQMEVRGVFVKKGAELPGDDVAKMSDAEKLAAHRQAVAELELKVGTNGGIH